MLPVLLAFGLLVAQQPWASLAQPAAPPCNHTSSLRWFASSYVSWTKSPFLNSVLASVPGDPASFRVVLNSTNQFQKVVATRTTVVALEFRRLWRSEDNGLTWKTVIDDGKALLDVDVRPETDELLVSSETGLRYSNDGGRQWRLLANSHTDLAAFYRKCKGCANAGPKHSGLGYIRTSRAALYVKEGDDVEERKVLSFNFHFGPEWRSTPSMVGLNIVAVSGDNQLWYSPDAGKTWKADKLAWSRGWGGTTRIFPHGWGFSISSTDIGSYFFTSDWGASWQAITLPESFYLGGMTISDDYNAMIYGNNDKGYISTDYDPLQPEFDLPLHGGTRDLQWTSISMVSSGCCRA